MEIDERWLAELRALVERNEQLLLKHAPRHDAQSAADPLSITSSAHAQSHALDSGSDHSGTLAWASVNKTGSSLADLATADPADLDNTDVSSAELETLTDGSDADGLHDHATLATAAEAIAAVEGEATLALDGAITEIHGDANFTLSIVSSNPRLTLDSGDYLEYNRAGNYFEANRMLTVPQLQTGEGLGLKVAIWGTFWGLGVQSGVFEFIASRGATGDFRWGYGTSGALTEVMYLDSGTGTLKVATIAELAANAGVTIETVELKDGLVDGVDIAARDHAEAHAIASHNDTTATGTELETLTDGSDADSLHDHSQFASAAEAITAVQGEATLDLAGDVTIAAGKKMAVGSAIQSAILYVAGSVADGTQQAMAFLLGQTLTGNDAANTHGIHGQVALDDDGNNKTGEVVAILGYLLKGGVGTATLFVCVDADASVNQGTVTDLYLYRAQNPAAGGTITNLHGLYIEDMTSGGTLNIAIHQVGTTGHNRLNANTKIGADATPAEALDVAGNIKVSGTVDGVDVAARDHAKYTGAEAITAVEAEATLDLAGDVTIAAGKGLVVDTSTLVVDAVNHRVGIGLATPRTALELLTGNSAVIMQKSGSTGFSISSYYPSLAMNMYHDGSQWIALGAGYVGKWHQNPTDGIMYLGVSAASRTAAQELGATPVDHCFQIAPGGYVSMHCPATSAWIQGLRMVAANMAATNMFYYAIGKAATNYNEGNVGFYYAGAGSASNRLSFWIYGSGMIMSLLATGRVGIRTTAPAAQLHIDQAVADAAIPVLALDQADESEGFINFIGSDRGVITGATDSLKSVRVELDGVVYRLALYVDA